MSSAHSGKCIAKILEKYKMFKCNRCLEQGEECKSSTFIRHPSTTKKH